MGRFLARSIVVGTVALVVSGIAIPDARAEVSVSPGAAVQGESATLKFQVVNDRTDTSTNRLELMLPMDHPLPAVTVQPKDGWRYETTKKALPQPVDVDGQKITETVTRVVWTLQDADDRIRAGEHDEFEVRVGKLPTDVDMLMFQAIQGYDNGSSDRWSQKPAEGSVEQPDGPGPELRLVRAPQGMPTGSVAALAIGMVPAGGGQSGGNPHSGMPDMDKEGMDTNVMPGMNGSSQPTNSDGSDRMSGMTMAGNMDMSPADEDAVNLALGLSMLGLFIGLLSGTFAGLAFARVRGRKGSAGNAVRT